MDHPRDNSGGLMVQTSTVLEPPQTELEPTPIPPDEEREEIVEPSGVWRPVVAIAFPLLAASIMVGGIFVGVAPRVHASIAAIAGVLVAVATRRVRRPLLTNLLMVGGLFGVGIVLVIPSGFDSLLNLGSHVVRAATSGDVLRPPAEYLVGWRAILAWLMASLGFAAGWTAIEIRRPALATLIPMIIAAIGAISVPKEQQLPTGIASFVLFAIGLGLLSSVRPGEQPIPLSFELRRFAKAAPFLVVVVALLVFLTRSNVLFPNPLIDPIREAQKPKAVPLTEVPDRVLFTVQSSISGPWRTGILDVYDGKDWRLPPFAQSRLRRVPESGVVDDELTPGFRATFEIRGLTGAVVPGLPNTVGVVAEGPELVYDHRNGNIRTVEGQLAPGSVYTVVAGRLPSFEELLRIPTSPSSKSLEPFTRIPSPPPVVRQLLSEAPTTSAWERLDFLRQRLLRVAVASGAGTPVSIPPERVDGILTTANEATPFEIVAAQAMLARWAGIPSRIGYGFDGGEKIGDVLEVRPRHGATFVEVYLPGFKWLPVLSTPLQARASLTESEQQTANVLPSNEVSIDLIVPLVHEPPSVLLQEIRQTVGVVAATVLLIALAYYVYPILAKARLRARRRKWAAERGPLGRIAAAYAEWRDFTMDLGYRHSTDTPLMFLDRVADDDEHIALAWLVTRVLWGDLSSDVTREDADLAEALSASLRKRTAQAHPYTLRTIAAVSRLSLRNPYAPRLDPRWEQRLRAYRVEASRAAS